MRFFIALNLLIVSVICKNILLTNDDGFAATNIRAAYRELKKAGHNVLLVAPVSQRSGWAGKFDIPPTKDLTTDGEFDYITKGSPSWGHEANDLNIWYFNGTPASCVAFGLKYVIPEFLNKSSSKNSSFDKVDLVVSGPNEGTNLSPGYFTISGTIGAAVAATYRGIPAIAFSGSNGNNSFFKDSLNEDSNEPSNIYAKKVTEFVNGLFEQQGSADRALPVGTGLNVNFPPVGSQAESCTDPKWVFSRIAGAKSFGPDVKYDEKSGMVEETDSVFNALNVCYNGDCSLPSEASILDNKSSCQASVSPFSVDFGANLHLTGQIKYALSKVL